MRMLVFVCALTLAATASGCAKNSISAPCFTENINGGFGSSCGNNR